jgi:hypothetical protein
MGWWNDDGSNGCPRFQVGGSVLGYIHNPDNRVSRNDVLRYNYGHHGNYASCIHVGHHIWGLLGVSKQYKRDSVHYPDQWNRDI